MLIMSACVIKLDSEHISRGAFANQGFPDLSPVGCDQHSRVQAFGLDVFRDVPAKVSASDRNCTTERTKCPEGDRPRW